MKPKHPLFIILLLFTGLSSLPVYSQESEECKSNKFSIKNRWNTKLSFSYNRTNAPNHPLMESDNIPPHPLQAKLNIRAECNYGVLDWLEVGGYIGYIRYYDDIYEQKMLAKGHDNTLGFIHSFAPVFGINANVHLLPFWVKNKNCRWELYLTAKYGGAYLINNSEFWLTWANVSSNGTGQSFVIHNLPNRYRQIYGAGVGGGVYFWNLFGLYAEFMAGQYSYFPEIVESYYTARVGIEFKFTSKKKKNPPAEIEEE
ncbi:MAG: hypothetical protein LBR36_09505 [Bacteroidales bacterium]|jgi:hypothetical protein|nr:hypothetical protein [Bacteroidales bacterium]